MKTNYKIILISIILLGLVMSFGAVSAADLNTVQSGEVSGGVDIASSNPGVENGELTYEIPDSVENIQYAGLFVDSYTAGSSNLVYGSEANITLTKNGESEQIASERLVASVGSADGEVYVINDHTTKCFADYMMTYNLTDRLQDAKGNITITVNATPIEGYTFYNKIKLIGLVFTYDDGDGDQFHYWVNAGSSWVKTDSGETSKATFKLGNVNYDPTVATLDNFALSSQDGVYTFNGKEMDESIVTETGVYYYIHHKFDILDKIKNMTNTLVYTPGEGSYSFRNVLSVVKLVKTVPVYAKVNISSEYDDIVFSGTENLLKVGITNNGTGSASYLLDLYADGKKVNSSQISLAAGREAVISLIDNTIRPSAADTVSGADNKKINYTVVVSDKNTGEVLDESSIFPNLLYNGYLGKGLAYPAEKISSFKNITVNGGMIIESLGDSTYLDASMTGKTDSWTIDLPDGAFFTDAFVYVPYNLDNGNVPMFTSTFNGAAVNPIASYRDQPNIGENAKNGYGLLVYDVGELIKAGVNSFALSKEAGIAGVYPSTLIAFYNLTDSDLLTSAFIFNGADLLSNEYNSLGRDVSSDNILSIGAFDGLVSAKLHVFAADCQAGEGDLTVNGKSYKNVWAGTNRSVGDYVVDLGKSTNASNEVSFISTASNILALQQLAVVQYNVPSVKASLVSEYSNAVFAGTNNVLSLNITNNGKFDSIYTVDFYVDGKKQNSTEISLKSGANKGLYLIDDTIRPIDASTVNGADNPKVNYTVVIIDKEKSMVLDEITITPSLLYNGNLGKDLAYPAENITSFRNITVSGGVIVDTLDDSTYINSQATNRTDIWNVNVADGDVFTDAFVYVPYNWDKTNGYMPVWNARFNGVAVSPLVSYRDQSNIGFFGKNGYGLVVYDVSKLIKSGENTFTLEKEAGITAVYPSTLMAFYNATSSNSLKTIYIYNGADLLANENNFLNRTVASDSHLDISSFKEVISAKLYVFSAGAQKGEGNIIFNNKTYKDVWNGTVNSVDSFIIDLGKSPSVSNDVSFVSTGSTIMALQQLIVLDYYVSSVKANVSSEYSGAVFAGTDNVLKVDLTNDGQGGSVYVLDFYIDGKIVNSTEIPLDAGKSTEIFLVDDKIRPVDASTVNGANNAKVNYTITVTDKASGLVLYEASLNPIVLYNGNLGKDLAYPAENISFFDAITVNGGVIIDTLDDSTYLGAKTTGRTDVWKVEIPKDGKIVDGFVYVSYNWDKTNGSMPIWNVSFNGVSVSPVAHYRDQSNMGTYGKYGYGLVVYDVGELIKSAENKFTLEKENGTTAVYPSTLLAFYNRTESNNRTTVYMYNGADLLSNANNFLGRTVASNAALDLALNPNDEIKSSRLYVFAASGQSGEGKLIVNNKTFNNVYNGSANSVDAYIIDLGKSPSASNNVSFIATGSTILALQQFVVVDAIHQSSEELQKMINSARAGSTLNLGSNVFKDVSNVIINKDLTITGGTIYAREGETIFVVTDRSAGGPKEVNITGVKFVLDNANTILQARAVNGSTPTSIDVASINIKKNNISFVDDDVVPESITVLDLKSQRSSIAPTRNLTISGNNLIAGICPFMFEVTSFNGKDSVVVPEGGNIPDKKASVIHYEDMVTTAINTNIEGRVGKYFEVNLTDSNGNPLKDKKVQIGFNGVVYDRTTNATGGVKLQINLGYKGTYTFAIAFLGDDYYNGSFVVAKIKVNTQKTKISTSSKTYKASAKTKAISATLKDASSNPISGKKLSFTVNGKTYSATTNSKGTATVNVSLSKKGTYSFTVKYAGDDMYAGATSSSKVVIK
ncbi:adhesin-like protein [Methanobrevibacter ruminantium M1]|uniref:Adhesin-like protein n=1 Tax=Methanobrevibacter ruminantium (strain ATCC 35063 / DSM 1093 / JCM 13430 / OCM 146 / M1) TaxID=634498 RepID=D3E0S4_METRM|nr:DUF3344 domain-containing protein [Methanobrevibacter ruminantium]ADC47898.1 adhesin-like protein [Methanobrevibacter ruminantium M1]